MDLSVAAARIVSIVYLSATLGAVLNPGLYKRIADELYGDSALTYIAGFMAVVLGGLLASFHNLWTGDWRVLITLIGWLTLAKGILLIAAPVFMRKVSAAFLSPAALRVFPWVTLALGLLFAWLGS